MKKKIIFIISLFAFLTLLFGATILYNQLSKNAAPGNLMTGNSAISSSETEPETTLKAEVETAVEAASETELETAAETASETEAKKDLYPAPDFTVYNAENKSVRLSELKGKPVIINFWASWCPPCKGEMPDFEDAYKEYGDQIQFMMINLTDGAQETVASASEYIKSQGYTFPIYYDTDISAAMAYGTSSIPASYFIDTDGNLAAYAVGMIDRTALETGIGMILK